MDSEIDMLERISQAIAPCAESNEKPPFSEEQLVIIAILALQRPASSREIFDWILENFSYYDQLARVAFWVQPYTHDRYVPPEGRTASQFRHNFARIFQQYEVPLATNIADDGNAFYNISTIKAWPWLKDIFEAKVEEKVFPFFDLPAEIRNTIYEYTFQYPDSGIMIIQEGQKCFCRGLMGPRMLGILDRSGDHEFSFEKWDRGCMARYGRMPYTDHMLRSKPLSTILAPLLTSRQFFVEAMPLFYSLNRFYFSRLIDMYNTLRFLAPSRRKFIKHVAFNFTKCDRGRSLDVPALKELVWLEGLSKLDVRLARGAITGLKGPGARGLHTLCKRRGLEEVTLSGDCERIRSRVMGYLLLPKASEDVPKKRKRKADVSEDEDAA